MSFVEQESSLQVGKGSGLRVRFSFNASVRRTLDRAAISLAVICCIHCLVTPVLLVVLPILATTFWVDENFHLWMLMLVIPSTMLAVWSGCRRHKDKWVVFSAALGLGVLVSALIAERWEHSQEQGEDLAHSQEMETDSTVLVAGGGCCELHPVQADCSLNGKGALSATVPLTLPTLLNTLGGCFLVVGHARNFLICRKSDCSHEESL